MIELDVESDWCEDTQTHLDRIDAGRFADRLEIERVNSKMYDPYLIKFTEYEFRSILTALLIARIVYEDNDKTQLVSEVELLATKISTQFADREFNPEANSFHSVDGSQIRLFDALVGNQPVEFPS